MPTYNTFSSAFILCIIRFALHYVMVSIFLPDTVDAKHVDEASSGDLNLNNAYNHRNLHNDVSTGSSA